MANAGFMWQCSCGHIEYGEDSPEECLLCSKIESFVKLPEELVAEREKDLPDETDEWGISSLKRAREKIKKNLKKKMDKIKLKPKRKK